VLTNSLIANTALTNSFIDRRSQPSYGGVLADHYGFDTGHHTDDVNSDGHGAFAGEIATVTPRNSIKRRTISANGMIAEIVQATRRDQLDYRYRGRFHMLIAYEEGVRREGATTVEGAAKSNLRDFRKKLTFVPAGHDYHECHDLRTLSRATFFYFDPAKMPVISEAGIATPAPRLYFENAAIWDTVLKLRSVIESPTETNQLYLEALGTVLAHELARIEPGTPASQGLARGGLAAWQQRIVTSYIEEHLSEQIPLATLSQLVRLSPFHFCRAFKQSFGMPPHRYHTSRRIEHAKTLLAKPDPSVTDIGLALGFSQTSSFTAAFRRATGFTPTAYHRSLG
jgi:AraC family transcriptional regulator